MTPLDLKRTRHGLHMLAIAAAVLLISGSPGPADAASSNDPGANNISITAKYKADRQVCQRLAGNARDICVQEAKGSERVARAELDQRDEPSTRHEHALRVAQADSAFAVSKEKCDDLAGQRKDVCRQTATSAHDTALAEATLNEKSAQAATTAKDKTRDAQEDARSDKREAADDLAKVKCEGLAGVARSNCLAQAKAQP